MEINVYTPSFSSYIGFFVLNVYANDYSVGPRWRCLSDNNNVIAGTKGQNKCVSLNILGLQFQSPPREKPNNREGGKFKKAGSLSNKQARADVE